MTDFSSLNITITDYAFLCKTADKTTAYAMNKNDHYIYKSFDGQNWQRVNILIKYGEYDNSGITRVIPAYTGPITGNQVIIVDQSSYNTKYATAYWADSEGITSINLENDYYKGKWQATEGYLYYLEQITSGGRRTTTLVRINESGTKQSIYSVSRNSQESFDPFSFYAYGDTVILTDDCTTTYVLRNAGSSRSAFPDKGDIKYIYQLSSSEYIVIADASIPNVTNSLNLTIYKYNINQNTFTKISEEYHSESRGRTRGKIYVRSIKNELQNSIYIKLAHYSQIQEKVTLNYSILRFNLDTLSLDSIFYGDQVQLPMDIGAGQLIAFKLFINAGEGYSIVYYTEEGGINWTSSPIQNNYYLYDLDLMENGNLLGKQENNSNKNYDGLFAKFNVKDSGVKVFFNNKVTDIRAYNLTNPNLVKINRIHVVNAAGEHVILYDRNIPDPTGTHGCYYDGKEIRYLYSV